MALGSDFTNHAVIIYDNGGNIVAETVVVDCDRALSIIGVEVQFDLRAGDTVQLVIFTEPVPCSFQGKLMARLQGIQRISLNSGHLKEDRQAARHKIDAPAIIESVMRDNELVAADAFTVKLMNISQSGVRFIGVPGKLRIEDQVQMKLMRGTVDHTLIAEVVNSKDTGRGYLEYGCRFLQRGKLT